MKNIIKITVILTAIFTLGLNTSYAQFDPVFTVKWNPCELQISDSYYFVDAAIYNQTTGELHTFFEIASDIPSTETETQITLLNWDCVQSIEKENYIVYFRVELRKTSAYCSGEVRRSSMTCSELYENLTFTVNMAY